MAVQENKVAFLKKIFLSDIDSWNKVLEEESSEWVRSVIKYVGLDDKIAFSSDKGKAVDYLVQNKTFVDFNIKNSSIKISKEGQLIGELKDVAFKTKVENGSPFVEISVEVWSVKDKPQKNKMENK